MKNVNLVLEKVYEIGQILNKTHSWKNENFKKKK